MRVLCVLFNGTLLFGYVPHNFGLGVVFPLIKDKFGDVSNTNNYAGITISSCTSKLFAISSYESYLESSDLQLRFRKRHDCSNAIFAIKSVVEHFIQCLFARYVQSF